MEAIKFNIGHSSINKKNHRKILLDIRKRINIFTSIKIIFVLFFSVIQLSLITNIFNKEKSAKRIKLEEEQNPLKNNKNKEIV